MRWITHQTGAVLGAFALALPLPGVVAAAIGAVFPDVIDQRLSRLALTKRGRQKIFNRVHRGTSHWIGWWLLLFLAAMAAPLPLLARDLATGFALGALSHVGLDMLTPQGVPLSPFSRKGRLAVPVCTTGNAGEYMFLALMAGAGVFWFRDALAPFLGEFARYF